MEFQQGQVSKGDNNWQSLGKKSPYEDKGEYQKLSAAEQARFRKVWQKQEGKFLDPKRDNQFKAILRDKEVLMDFLKAFIREPIGEVKELIEGANEQVSCHPDLPKVIYDIKVLIKGPKAVKHECIIEIQCAHQPNFLKRAQYYIAREIVSQAEESGTITKWKYEMTPVILIAVLDFDPKTTWSKGDKGYYYNFQMLETTSHQRLDTAQSYYFVLLPKFKGEVELLDPTDKIQRRAVWCYMLSCLGELTEQEFNSKKSFCSDPVFGKIAKALRVSNLSTEERMNITLEDMQRADWEGALESKFEAGIKIGKRSGRKEGRKEGKEEGIEIGIPKGIELGRLEADVAHYQKLKDRGGMGDKEICEILEWTKEHLNTIKRAVTSPKLELNQENQADRTVE